MSWKIMSKNKKSPLRNGALRAPGQSLSEAIEELAYGKIMPWSLVGLMLLTLAAYEWIKWFSKSPPRPVFMSVLAVIGCGLVALRIKRQIFPLRQLSLGLEGEKVVGQSLEQLRARGYEVFHDIVGDGHNIDHALVGPGGIFAIETKTIRKPARGESEVVFDGGAITVNGMTPDRDPVVQVQAAARELAAVIRNTSGRDIFVRPVIIYPGWFTRHLTTSAVWVLNQNALPKFIEHEDVRLSADEVKLIAAGIAMHVRHARSDG